MSIDNLMVFTGNANPRLANDVVRHLNIHLGRATVSRFSDGEVMVEILENVRGKDVFVLQSTCQPTNDTLMEVMVMVDALKRASAGRITAAIPYYGYARQDRRTRAKQPMRAFHCLPSGNRYARLAEFRRNSPSASIRFKRVSISVLRALSTSFRSPRPAR